MIIRTFEGRLKCLLESLRRVEWFLQDVALAKGQPEEHQQAWVTEYLPWDLDRIETWVALAEEGRG